MYEKSFYLTEPVSNNRFSFESRKNKRLFVPSLIEGGLEDVQVGLEIVFEDFDNGVLRSSRGLEHFVKISRDKGPIYVFDNHNHAFAFWHLEWFAGTLSADDDDGGGDGHEGALLIHVDQHKDTRIPDSFLTRDEARDPEKVFTYANSVLNVGNFIPAAQKTGLIREIVFVGSEQAISEFDYALLERGNIILDVDLDFFAPELDYIGNESKLALIARVAPHASVITFATSPFFIEQELALAWLKKLARLLGIL